MTTSSIPTIEPSIVTAGDTLEWTREITSYPASDGWTLSYAFGGPGTIPSVTGTADGSLHKISVPTTTSASWTAGIYNWQAYVTKDSARHTVGRGTIEVKPNLATVAGVYDGRTHIKKMLDAIEAVLEGTGTLEQQEVTLDGIALKRREIIDLITLREKYSAWYKQELAAERVAKGLGSGRKILVRFG